MFCEGVLPLDSGVSSSKSIETDEKSLSNELDSEEVPSCDEKVMKVVYYHLLSKFFSFCSACFHCFSHVIFPYLGEFKF